MERAEIVMINENENKNSDDHSLDRYLLHRKQVLRNPYEGKTIQHFSAVGNDATMDLLTIMDSDEYQNSPYFYRLPLGISDGTPVIENLSDISNLLITGIPNSGKTAFINSLLMSLMLSHTPDEFCCFCFNSKPFEYPVSGRHPYTLLDSRQLILGDFPLDDVRKGVSLVREYFPNIEIIIVLDDLYDFLHTYGRDNLIDILRMGIDRKIHVFMATNLLSGRELTPEIRGLAQNFISFRQYRDVSRLLGIHDAEYLKTPGVAIVHLNGMKYRCSTVFLEESQLDSLNATLCQERKSAVAELISDKFSFSQTISLNSINEAEDPLLDEIIDYLIDVQKASTSLLQRRFGIGYNRAAKMINLLEEKGVISPAQESKPREVYISRDIDVKYRKSNSASSAFSEQVNPVYSHSEKTHSIEFSPEEKRSHNTENSDIESEHTSVSKLVFPEQSLVRKVTRVKEETITKHHGIDTDCWIEDGKLVIETTNLELLPEEYVRDALQRSRGPFRKQSISKATFSMDVHRICHVTFGRPKKSKGYVHVYFDEVNFDISVNGTYNNQNATSELDIRLPFAKEQESEFEQFAKELVRKSRT